tara:strand:+ start:180 stop:374 length:195 start_codon:yes stop_codon:yes gene_type:complete
MNTFSNWKFYKQDKEQILWIYICAEDLTGIAISIKKWWKKSYPNYKIRVVSKNEFDLVTVWNKI